MPTMINGYLEVNDARESFLHNTMFKHLTMSSSGVVKHNRWRQVSASNIGLQCSDWNLLELWMLTICQNWPAASAGQNRESWAFYRIVHSFRAGVVWSVQRRSDALDLRIGWPGWQNGNHPWLWAHRFRMLIKKNTHTYTRTNHSKPFPGTKAYSVLWKLSTTRSFIFCWMWNRL